MNRLFCCVMLVVVAVASFVAASPAKQGLDRRVSIDVAATPPAQVLGSIARALDCRLRIDEATTAAGPVSLRLLNVRARVALDAICDGAGCQWQFDGQVLVVSRAQAPAAGSGRPPVDLTAARLRLLQRRLPSDLRVANATVRAALDQIGKAADIDIDIDVDTDSRDADRLVSADIGGLPFLDAIRKVLAGTRLDGQIFVGFAGPTTCKIRIGAKRR